jgi:site-specific recombinase XerD
MTELHKIPPEEAVEQYLESRHDVTESTLDNHDYRLGYFVEWANLTGLGSLDKLDGYDLQQYKNWRVNETDCNLVTIEQHLHTLRVFLRWAESSNLVREGTADNVVIPNVSSQDKARDIAISSERANQIIDYLVEYQWARTSHLVFHLLWHCGMRRSGLRALDVGDWHPDEQYLEIVNRSETGTRLKLGDDGERNVTVTDERLADAIDSYIDGRRPEVTDDHGRKPLLASNQGRYHYQSLTKIAYKVTRPCWYGVECPHDRDPEECDATEYSNYSSCPSSVSAHPLRRSSITHHLSEDIPTKICSERMSVSPQTLDLHYDARSKEEKRQNREQYLNDL